MPDYRKLQKNIKPWKLEVPMQSVDCTVYSMDINDVGDTIVGAGKNGLIPVRHGGTWKLLQIRNNVDLYGVAIAHGVVCLVGSIKIGPNVGTFCTTVSLSDLIAGNVSNIKNQLSGNGALFRVAWNEGSGSFVAIHEQGGVWTKQGNNLWKYLIEEKQLRAPRSIVSGDGTTVYIGSVNGMVYSVDALTGKKGGFDCDDARSLLHVGKGLILTGGKSIGYCLIDEPANRKVSTTCIFEAHDDGTVKHSEANILSLVQIGNNVRYAGFGSDGLTYTMAYNKDEISVIASRESFYPSKGTMIGSVYNPADGRVYACGSGIDPKLNACIVSKYRDDFNWKNYWEVGDKPTPEPTPEPKPIEPPVEPKPVVPPVVPPIPDTEPEPDDVPAAPVEPVPDWTPLDKKIHRFGLDMLTILRQADTIWEEFNKDGGSFKR